MAVNFAMREVMRGTHHFVDKSLGSTDETEFYFKIKWGQKFSSFLNPVSPDCFKADAKGVINVSGLTKGEIPTEGSLELRYLTEQKLRYTLNFKVDKKRYQYIGEKVDVKLWQPLFLVKTHTTCYGYIKDPKGEVISRSVTHFELKPQNIISFVASLRVLPF